MRAEALSVLVLATALAGPVVAQDGGDWEAVRKDVRIPMRDREWLAADVYLPPRSGKYPAVLVQTPYNKALMRAQFALGRGPAWADRARYAYVVVDWRGFHGSRRARRLGANGGQDGYDCVEWVAKQSWCNGKVGTWGGSALAKAQFETAIARPPHLVCCVPMIANMGLDYRAFYPGGVLLEDHLNTLDKLGFGLGKGVRSAPYGTHMMWGFVKRKSYKPPLVQVPMLLISGWWDLAPKLVLETFTDLVRGGGELTKKHSKLIVGPWTHVSVGKAAQGELSYPKATATPDDAVRRFLAYWLLEQKDNGWADQPTYRYYQLGEDRWVGATAWPGVPTKQRTWYLSADGKIGPARPTGEAAATRAYTHDPKADPVPTIGGANLPPRKHGPYRQNALEKRTDVLTYSTGPLDAPLRLAGQLFMDVSLAVNRVDHDLHVRLCHVHPDGSSYLMTDYARRCKMHTGRPLPLKPGTVITVRLHMQPIAWTIPKGHQLRILVSSSNHPRYERNPHTGNSHWNADDARDVGVTIHHGKGGKTSGILLPVLSGDDGQD